MHAAPVTLDRVVRKCFPMDGNNRAYKCGRATISEPTVVRRTRSFKFWAASAAADSQVGPLLAQMDGCGDAIVLQTENLELGVIVI